MPQYDEFGGVIVEAATPAQSAQPAEERDEFGGIVTQPGVKTFHQQVQGLTRNNAAEAVAQATGDILHRESGLTLVKTDNGDGTFTYTPTQTQTPQKLSTREQLAIYQAHAADKRFGEYVGDQIGRAGQLLPSQIEEAQNAESFARVKARRVAGQTGITNFSNALVGGGLQIGPSVLELTKPMEGNSITAKFHQALLNYFLPGMETPEAQQLRDRVRQGADQMAADTYTIDPNSTAGKVGRLGAGIVRYAVPAIGAAADAGEYRRQVEEARRRGTPITPEQEFIGAATIFGSTMALGHYMPGKATALGELAASRGFKDSLTKAVTQYALEAGYSSANMAVLPGIHNAVKKFTTDPNQYISEGMGESAAVGAAGHGLFGLSRFIKDVKAGAAGEGVESKLRALYEQKIEADRILQSGEQLPPAFEAGLKKVSDHNAALMNRVLENVERYSGPESMESMLERVTAAVEEGKTVKPAESAPTESAVKAPGTTAIPEVQLEKSVEAPASSQMIQENKPTNPDFAALMNEPFKDVRPGTLNEPAPIHIEEHARQAAEIAEKGVGRDVRRLLGEPEPGLQKPPKEIHEGDLTPLKEWAKANGYKVRDTDNRRTLLRSMARQRNNSMTELPELPQDWKTWNPKQLRHWSESNGYDVEGVTYTAEMARMIREQHADSIERVKKGAEAESRLNLPDAASVEKGKPAEQPTIAQTEKTTAQQADIARETIEKAANKKRSLLSGPTKLAKNLLLDVGEQIRDVSPRVFGRLMKAVELEPRQRIAATRSELAPGIKRINEFLGKPGSERAEKWHELWLDQDGAGLRAMLPESLRPDFDAIYPVLRDLHTREAKMGIREGNLGTDYLPSSVKDLDLLRSLRPEKMGEIEEAWKLREAAEGRPLTDAEKLDVANNVAAGYGPNPAGGVRPGFAKERTRGKLTAEERAAYERWDTALLHRIERGEMAIGKAEFFGKAKAGDLMTSIGRLLTDEINAGRLKGEKQRELTALLHTRFMGDANTPGQTVRHLRQAVHLVALSHITSGLRQLTDLATTASRHGLANTINAAGDALRFQGKDRALFLHSLGLDPVHHDFVDLNLLGKAVDKVTRWNGFQKIDVFTKEVEINAFRRKLESAAKNRNSRDFRRIERDWKDVMGEKDFADAVDAAERGDFTNRNLRDLSAMVLSEVQPITMTQMPPKYLQSQDGRIWYTLHTYQIKQLANIRRQIVQRLATPGQRKEGIQQAAGLLAYGALAGFGMSALRDLIEGKDLSTTSVKDRALDSGMSIIGLNRYLAKNVVAGQPIQTMLDMMTSLPASNFDAPFRDLATVGDEKGLESMRLLPAPFDLLYFWSPWGRGYTKNKEAADAEYRKMLGDLHRQASEAYQSGDTQTAMELLMFYNDRRKEGPRDGRKGPLSVGDLRYPPPDADQIKANHKLKDRATEAYRNGDIGKASELLAELNVGRRHPIKMKQLATVGEEE